MMFYVRGSGPAEGEGTSNANFVTMFGILSLGNIGVSDYTCANINVGRYEKVFQLNCQYGTMRELFEFGLQKIDNQSCTYDAGTFLGENDAWDDLQFDCNLDNGLQDLGRQKLF